MVPASYWIGVAARAHVMVGQTDGFVMVAHGSHSAVRRLQPGDWFAYYAPTQTLGGKDTVRRFVAIGQIADGEPMQRQMTVDVTGWCRPAHYSRSRRLSPPGPVRLCHRPQPLGHVFSQVAV